LGFLALCLAACSKEKLSYLPVYPTRGRVLQANGQPVMGGRVILVPRDPAVGHRAFGDIGANGNFTLTTYAPRDGVAAGDYIAVVEPHNDGDQGQMKQGQPTPIDSRYQNVRLSGLSVNIHEGDNVIDLTVQ
jgi:hypothetical protein